VTPLGREGPPGHWEIAEILAIFEQRGDIDLLNARISDGTAGGDRVVRNR
jgi:hypothetical protein